jgi:hypothetical protein
MIFQFHMLYFQVGICYVRRSYSTHISGEDNVPADIGVHHPGEADAAEDEGFAEDEPGGAVASWQQHPQPGAIAWLQNLQNVQYFS